MKPAHRVQAAVAAAFALSFVAQAVEASVIWSATSVSSFRSNEQQDCDGNYHSTNGSTITNVTDPTFGSVIRFHKVTDDRRCEGKGASGVTITRGVTYYIGWRWKLSSTTNDNSIFQWKSYGSPITQNYPLVIKMINNQLNLQYYPGGGGATTLYRVNVSPNTWYPMVLRVSAADTASAGKVQFWWGTNSTPVTLLTGGNTFTGKTFDGSEINPKWGKYGACGTTIDSYVDDLKIGTTWADVVPGGASATPTATPTATATSTPTATPTPTATATPVSSYVEVTPTGSAVTASTNDGHVPANTVDNDLATRWSANGDGQWIQYDLGTARTVGYVNVALYQGNMRTSRFDVQVSNGGGAWTTVWSGSSTGTTTAEQKYDFPDVSARWVRYLGHGNSTNMWNSVSEVSIFAAP
jgi:hypothetical protein